MRHAVALRVFVADAIDPILGGERRAPDRRRPGVLVCEPRTARHVRLPGADRPQDAAVGAGSVFLQQLALLQGFDLAELTDAEYVHVIVGGEARLRRP